MQWQAQERANMLNSMMQLQMQQALITAAEQKQAQIFAQQQQQLQIKQEIERQQLEQQRAREAYERNARAARDGLSL